MMVDVTEIFVTERLLGKGTFGAVYQARCILDSKFTTSRYAVKIGHRTQFPCCWTNPACQCKLSAEGIAELYANGVAHEIDVLANLRHPNIVQLIWQGFTLSSTCETGFRPMYVMTRAKCAMIAMRPRPDLTFRFCLQIFDALAYLHRMNLAHCDVCTSNILVQSEAPLHISLSDFGAARIVHRDSGQIDPTYTPLALCCTTFRCASPQCYSAFHHQPVSAEDGGYVDSTRCDVWAAGMCTLALGGLWTDKHHSFPHPQDAQYNHLFATDVPEHYRRRVFAQFVHPPALADLLASHALVSNQRLRQSASNCLKSLCEIATFAS